MMSIILIVSLSLIHGCAADNIDGSLLSYELKRIKTGVGVDYIQKQYDSFPYETQSESGNKLLENIQNSLDTSLQQLNNVLEVVKGKLADNKDGSSTNLPRCCDLQENDLTYIPEFQKGVDLNTACYTTPPISDSSFEYPPDTISDTMKSNYQNNKNVLWQHYSTASGISVLYPATTWYNCQNFDPRFTSAYAAAASPKDKDVVIVLDTSSSMKKPTNVQSKNRMVIAKEAGNNVLQTLKPNDRVGVVTFDNEAMTPSPSSYDSCYGNELAFATKVNIDELKDFVLKINPSDNVDSNFEKALTSAFNLFAKSNETVDVENRDQIILFVTDGKATKGKDPVQIIADENKKFQNRIMIFTYLIAEESAKVQLEDMSQQTLSNTTYGQVKTGIFSFFDFENQKYLSTKMATLHLEMGSHPDTSTFTVPAVDAFSGVGLTTSLCLRVNDIGGLRGVVCTDVKISELLTEVEYFSEDEYSYAFIIDGTGRVLMHPLLPNAAFVKSDEDPVLVDISVLEREEDALSMISSMKSGSSGSKTYYKFFTKPRGQLVNDGSRKIPLNTEFFWGPVPNSNFSVCIVIPVNQAYSEIKEADLLKTMNADLGPVFMYHNRSILSDNFKDCKFYKRRVTLDRSCVNFSPSAFSNPFQYIDRYETAEDVTTWKNYLSKSSSTNPGFKATLRPAVWASYKAEQFWKKNEARYVSWRYMGTKAGVIRIYPGVSLQKTYDHKKRAWWRQILAHPDMMFITTPYVDAWGSGIVISIMHTIHKRNSSQTTAVVAADFPLEYFNWFINQVYPSCESEYKCIIVEDSGFVVLNPKLKETKTEAEFQAPKHITVEEAGIADKLKRKGVLNRDECQDFSKNRDLRSYRVTLPQGMTGGLDFAATNDYFEFRPIPETNLFIIRVKKDSLSSDGCTCDTQKSPDAVDCSSTCECLCYNPIQYDVCSNNYDTSAGTPCSARLPDTSGISKPDVIDGLQACHPSTCHLKQSKEDCFSEAECSWCEFTDIGAAIKDPCCRPKEECTFGKTAHSNRDTCTPPPTTPKPENDDPQNLGAIIGGSIAAGVLFTLIVIGGIYILRHQRDKDDPDPYIDAVHEHEDTNEMSDCGSSGSPPPPYKENPNFHYGNEYIDK